MVFFFVQCSLLHTSGYGTGWLYFWLQERAGANQELLLPVLSIGRTLTIGA